MAKFILVMLQLENFTCYGVMLKATIRSLHKVQNSKKKIDHYMLKDLQTDYTLFLFRWLWFGLSIFRSSYSCSACCDHLIVWYRAEARHKPLITSAIVWSVLLSQVFGNLAQIISHQVVHQMVNYVLWRTVYSLCWYAASQVPHFKFSSYSPY
jgi:hypothetical protein